MKNHYLVVKFSTESLLPSRESPHEFGPFRLVQIELKNRCPVCGAALSGTSCNCEGFTSKLTQLRTDYHDEGMLFHYSDFGPIPCVFPLKDVLRIMASDEEQQHLDWTNASLSVDDEKKCGFQIIGISYDADFRTAIFFYKEIGSNEVWKGIISRVDLQMPGILFGKYIPRVTPNLFGKASGGYYEVVRDFTDWDEVCVFLTK